MQFSVLLLALLSFSASSALFQTEEFLRIDSPAAETVVSGIVDVRGTAAAPGMMRYRVEFAYDPNPSETWFLIAEETEPVTDGLLAVWDTSAVTQGEYALRITAFFADGSMREAVNHGIRVLRESSPAALPSLEGVTPVAPDPQTNFKPASAFPAPTAVFPSDSSARSGAASSRGTAFLIGAFLAVSAFGLYWIRSRWLWWKHRELIRKNRKDGGL